MVMANHVHALLLPKIHPSRMMHSMKGFTARQANRILTTTGKPFWQAESYDHWVRDEREYASIAAYITNNPVRAGQATRPEEYRWSSAYPGERLDTSVEAAGMSARATGLPIP
jgi:REP element-mobilizing transposase RayT